MQKLVSGDIKKNERLMSLLSVWGILLVVLGHSGFSEFLIYRRFGSLQSWIYSFHMPLFVFISGFLYSYTQSSFIKIDDRKFFIKKAKRLLIPYFILGTILFFIKFTFSSLSHVKRDFSFYSYCEMFIIPQSENSTIGYLWFVSALFLIFVIVRMMSFFKINLKNSYINVFLVLACWFFVYVMPKIDVFQISSVMWYLSFFILGISYHINQKNINSLFYLNHIWVMLMLFVLTIFPIPIFSTFITNIVKAIIGILFSISLCCIILKCFRNNKILFSKYTYSIYLLSWFGQYGVQILLTKIFRLSIAPYFLIILFLSGIIFPVIFCKIVEKWDKNNIFVKNIRLIIGLS